jgi:Ala-tRNA(Pro) deacylase
MITGIKKGVTLFIDSELKSCSHIYAHPLVNDRTISMTIPALEQFFEKINVDIHWITLDDLSN